MNPTTNHNLMLTAFETANITLVKMHGSLSSTTAVQASDELQRTLDRGTNKVILNMADVDYISSSGLYAILRLFKRLDRQQGGLKISRAKGMVHDCLVISGFNLSIQLCNTDEEAIAAFNEQGPAPPRTVLSKNVIAS